VPGREADDRHEVEHEAEDSRPAVRDRKRTTDESLEEVLGEA
jgi:hypothetical protein